VRNWIEKGKLPALHVGRRVRICRADFDQLLEASVIATA
jgi:excisionase family DNA binding protein